MLFEVNNVSAGYGQLRVLESVSLKVPPGSVVGLLGPNGAGKTTLLRTIAGIITPWSGSIRLDGRELGKTSVASRARDGLCLVPEGRAIFPALTVRENFAMHAQTRRLGHAADEVYEMFPLLARRLDQVAGTMSGGEQQMLALSRAVIRKTSLLLADELSFGLAPIVLDAIFGALRKMKAAGTSMLVVEQYADRLLEIADYVYVMSKGRLVLEGVPANISREELWRAQHS